MKRDERRECEGAAVGVSAVGQTTETRQERKCHGVTGGLINFAQYMTVIIGVYAGRADPAGGKRAGSVQRCVDTYACCQ